ncbi:hypothetical protein P9G49_15320 [Heyndrickxia coagulans]|uniref:hypothetical protein n=1 Tax=Heyndrickxia coagulans TaxID=1398 RepID=UPI002E058E98|nr:hypothetical protein [Heyndrickxia coagulans]
MEYPIFKPCREKLDTYNQDRHCDNWGIIYDNNEYRIAPVYDNGASLGFQLKENRIRLMDKDCNMFKAFSNRSYSLIGLPEKKKPRFLDLLTVIKQYYPLETKESINSLNKINLQMLQEIVDSIPEKVMGPVYKKWVKKLLLYRKEWLLNWYKGGA